MWILRLGVFVGVVLICVVVTVIALNRLEVRKAKRFLDDVRQLSPGRSSLEDVKRLTANYRQHLIHSPSDEQQERFVFAFSNEPLYWVGAARPLYLIGGILVEKDRLTQIDLAIQGSPPIAAGVVEIPHGEGIPPYRISSKGSGSSRLQINVRITTACNPEQRRRAYAFDLDCLTRIRGCGNADELMPEIPKHESDATSPER
jgi:hypothetical protein